MLFWQGFEGDVFEGVLKNLAHINTTASTRAAKVRRVAIKVCRSRKFNEEELQNELRIFARCRHDNIVTFHGWYHAALPMQDNVLHIVMEWMDGGTLRKEINNMVER